MKIAALLLVADRINYINDFDPVTHKFKQPIYAIEPGVAKTGTLECYKPKGAWDNPDKRNWLKYEVSHCWASSRPLRKTHTAGLQFSQVVNQ